MKIKENINLIITFIQLIAFLIIVFFLVKIFIWGKNSLNDKSINDNLNNEVINSKDIVDVENTETAKNDILEIDFKKLKQINSDIIAWIRIKNTNINYPILQAYDNEFYLHRNFKKEYSQSGSIFLNSNNNMFLDKNTIIYGHNMRDNTMFHDLFKIYNNELGDEVFIEIYTENDITLYKVFSTYIDFPYNIKYNYDFNELIKKSKINFNTSNVNYEKILTLYTCNFSGNKRLIVQAAKNNLFN